MNNSPMYETWDHIARRTAERFRAMSAEDQETVRQCVTIGQQNSKSDIGVMVSDLAAVGLHRVMRIIDEAEAGKQGG